MNLKFLEILTEPESEISPILSLAFSPNGQKLGIATAFRQILLFDEKFKRRDKFATKPANPQLKTNYQIRKIFFSPDSTKLAVAQTDKIVFVYRLGDHWDEKKVICNKFNQTAAATTIFWSEENRLIIGLSDGRIRNASVGSNKCSTLYKTDSMVLSVSVHPNGKSLVSGHSDGSIILFSFESLSQSLVVMHSTAPNCLLFTNFGVLAVGSDRRLISYTESGRVLQQFDFSRQADEKEWTTGILDPSGLNAVFGSFDRLRLFSWNGRRGAFDEGSRISLQNFYSVSSLAWKSDGSQIVAGGLTGATVLIDCCLRRALLKGRFENTYISASQIVIRDTETSNQCGIRSAKGLPINDVRIMGRTNRFVVARTSNSLLIADMETQKSSEILWESGGNEKFYFDNENVCLIMNAGEVNIVEYGRNEVIGWIRTERSNPHLISVRLDERRRTSSSRRVAFLIDFHTVAIADLPGTVQIAQVSHSSLIDWLELNETAEKLLFRDVRSALYLHNIEKNETAIMIPLCSYVQWVPRSDVVVAQSGQQLCLWYNTDQADRLVQIPINGDVEMVLRDRNRTEVIVLENNSKVAYELDSTLIEFGTAIDDVDLGRAMMFLEEAEKSGTETATMWRQLSVVALREQRFLIAQRSFAALGDYARANFIAETLEMAEMEGIENFRVKARCALLRRELKEAEREYLANVGSNIEKRFQNATEEALEMYQKLHKWTAALQLAKAVNYPDIDRLHSRYIRTLHETGQEDRAAELKAEEGKPLEAIDLYLRANRPLPAANVLVDNRQLALDDEMLVEKVVDALMRSELFAKAGELKELIGRNDAALELFEKGNEFAKAVNLARRSFPEKVTGLEEKWGDNLCEIGNHEAAISHFLECGQSEKAIRAAIAAKEWKKAMEILEVAKRSENTAEYFVEIAKHFESEGDYDKAERFFLDAGMPDDAIQMYNRASRWADAHKLASEFLGTEETQRLYSEKAAELEEMGRWKEAEELFIAVGEPNRAIGMYKTANRLDDVMRLVERFHTEHVDETRRRLAEDLVENGDFKAAEEHFVQSGNWQSAVEMYGDAEQWPEAYRVARTFGGDAARKPVAFGWAKSLGGDAAVRLLQTYNLLDEAITFGIEKREFDFVFELCRLGATHRLVETQTQYAEHLEDNGDLQRAEQFYLQSSKPREAVSMYIHHNEWEEAERVANVHCPEALNEVYIGHARAALEAEDHQKAEGFLLRANRTDIILKYYQEMGIWSEALRIAREYLPDALPQLQTEYDQIQRRTALNDTETLMQRAKEWELSEEYSHAIECYMMVDNPVTSDSKEIATAFSKAGDLAIKFLENDSKKEELITEIGNRLQNLGENTAAGDLYLAADRPQEAIAALVKGNEWSKAKKIAAQLAPEIQSQVDDAYKEYLRNQGRVGELLDVDVVSAIDMLAENGQWEKAIMTAKEQNVTALTDKYVAMYAAQLIADDRIGAAVRLFEENGAVANSHNFNIYKRLIDSTINERSCSFASLRSLRNMIFQLNRNLRKIKDSTDPRILNSFERYLYLLHFIAVLKALEVTETNDGNNLKLKLRISLLRYLDLAQPDKLFYEAGMECRKAGAEYLNMAFAFHNQYLDIVDSIELDDPSVVDNSIFEGTDVPLQYSLPNQMFLTKEEHEELKEWVLSISVERNIAKELKLDDRGVYEASYVDLSGKEYPICALSGYPILGSPIQLGNGICLDSVVRQTFSDILRSSPTEELLNIQTFISEWSGSSIML